MYFKVRQVNHSINENGNIIETPYHIIMYFDNTKQFFSIEYTVKYINQYLPITEDEYMQILTQFNAIYGQFFNNKNDAQNAANYLNETYTTIINLVGD